MGNTIKLIEKTISEEKKNIEGSSGTFVSISVLLAIFVILFTLVCFLWHIPFLKFDSPIDSEKWGQFGDFIGGIVGTFITIVTIIFLYLTFKDQHLSYIEAREVNRELLKRSQEEVAHKNVQLFDGNFNVVLELYHKSIANYKSPSESIPKGKASMSNLVSSFINSTEFTNNESYLKRSDKALNKFEEFLSKNMTEVNAHMKLLYRLLSLIDESQIDEDTKHRYAKLLRSQLTDEELILIRYNCMSQRGIKMRRLVFNYNILKHLPMMGLFEFKKYRKGLSSLQIHRLNDELIMVRKEICNLFRSPYIDTFQKEYGNRYKINVAVSDKRNKYEFTLIKLPKVTGPKNIMEKVLDNYYDDNELLRSLLVDFHSELFRCSCFRLYNRDNTYKLAPNISMQNNITEFKIVISQSMPLILSYSQIEHPVCS